MAADNESSGIQAVEPTAPGAVFGLSSLPSGRNGRFSVKNYLWALSERLFSENIVHRSVNPSPVP